MEPKRFFQIDVLKGLAIFSVIAIHSIPDTIRGGQDGLLINMFSVFHIWQAVPVFIIIIGLNWGASIARGFKSLNCIFSFGWFKKRIKRVIPPFILIFILSLLLGYGKDIVKGRQLLHLDILNLIGLLPVTGPGNYFVTILFQAIIFLPLLYYLFRIDSRLMLFTSFIINIFFELTAPFIDIFSTYPYLYSACIFRYFFAIGLGIWISKEGEILSKNNRFLLIGLAASIVYLFVWNTYSYAFPYFLDNWKWQNIFSFFYPVALVMLGIKYLPKSSNNKIIKQIAFAGKLSYHIFLIQMLYFTSFSIKTIVQKLDISWIYETFYGGFVLGLTILGDIIVCTVLGLMFFWGERKLITVLFKEKRK